MLGNRYEIKQILGEGSTSTVYLGLDRAEGTEVAIKSLPGGSSREHEIHSSVDHEHIIRVLNYIEGPHHAYMVLEKCDGNLISFINGYDVDLKGVLRIVRMILLGCHHLHSRRIIHRDIKLGNILVKGNTVKICDLGLSCHETDNDYSYCGTKDYLAPEIERRLGCVDYMGKMGAGETGGYDCKVDVYAVGIVFKALLTRKKNIPVDEIESISPQTKRFLMRLLHADPRQRFSAREALGDEIFAPLFAQVPDFRLVKAFVKRNKYGEIRREGACAAIRYAGLDAPKQDGISAAYRHELRLDYSSAECSCRGPFGISIKIDGTAVERELLTNSQLVYYNYLCGYLAILCSKTAKLSLEQNGHQYKLFVDGSYAYSHGTTSITHAKGSTSCMIDGQRATGVPPETQKLLGYFTRRCEEKTKACICARGALTEPGSTVNLSLSTGLVAKEYEFINGLGWCVRNNLQFLFLLNTGARYTVNARQGVLIDSDRAYTISRDMPAAYMPVLRVVRQFLMQMYGLKGAAAH
ncbi:hypothetical protein PAPHI01_0328 [Pancytospora philotis]|nr:hypothetical protein PAPHI01_0328 [Pancytospora philotis]